MSQTTNYRMLLLLPVVLVLLAGTASAQTPLFEVENSSAWKLMQVNEDAGLLALGVYTLGTIPASGAGVRLMWYPRKAAFRVGRVLGTQWDDGMIGVTSVAMGINTTASGSSSVAMGEETTASGNAAFAMGFQTTASNFHATALGQTTQASGQQSFAGGWNSTASGGISFAFGNGANASGQGAIALGWGGTTASGAVSFAVGGDGAVASGTNSVALIGGTASGDYSVAIGRSLTASGQRSIVMGSSASSNSRLGTFVFGDWGPSSGSAVQAVADNQFVVRAQNIWLGQNNSVTATTGRFLETSTGAYLTTGGTWTNSSDVNRKHLFEQVDGEQVLAKIRRLPIQSWSYKSEGASVRHIGPTAQDFRAAFGLGDTDQAIATVDIAGVNMLAIQALERRTRELHEQVERIEALERRLAELEAQNAALARRLERLEGALPR